MSFNLHDMNSSDVPIRPAGGVSAPIGGLVTKGEQFLSQGAGYFRDLTEFDDLAIRTINSFWGSIFLMLLLLLTNRYLSLAYDSEVLPGDCFSYLRIASAFPSLPTLDAGIPAHHAQRFIIPYLVGAFSRLTHLPLEVSFRVFAIGAMLSIVGLFCRILRRLHGLLPLHSLWLLALLILNPYSFRIYIAAPYLLNDLFFQVGLTMLLFGLFEESIEISLVGVSLAICSRQTALLLIPPMLLWLMCLWPKTRKKAALFTGLAATAIILIIYGITSYVALEISGQLVSTAHVIGLFTWLRGSPSFKAFIEFSLRGVIGLTFPIAALLGTLPKISCISEWSREDHLRAGGLLGFAAMIAAQPILGGPTVTAHDITRLVLLGLTPLLIVVAICFSYTTLSQEFWKQAIPLLMVTVALGSFHHMYSFLGVGNGAERTTRFALVHFGCGTLLFLGLKALAMRVKQSLPAMEVSRTMGSIG